METAAKDTFGTELWMGPAGGTLVKVAQLLDFDPPKTNRSTMDATTHESPDGAEEVIPSGTYKVGSFKAKVHYIPLTTNDVAMMAAVTSGAKQDFKVVVKGASGTVDQTFSGYATGYEPDNFPTDGKQTASFSADVTGPMTQAATS